MAHLQDFKKNCILKFEGGLKFEMFFLTFLHFLFCEKIVAKFGHFEIHCKIREVLIFAVL